LEQDEQMAGFIIGVEVAVVRVRTGSDLLHVGGMSASRERRDL
jgi:hypothetical protein